jgi:hypothetical protein
MRLGAPRLRFTLGSLMAFVTAIAVGLGFYLVWHDRQEFESEAKAWRTASSAVRRPFEMSFRKEESQRALVWTTAEVLQRIKTDPNYHQLRLAEYWCVNNRAVIIPDLIELLKDRSEPGLTNSADLIIPERLNTGEIKFYGHGGIVNDDLFTVAGRASWLLKEITGREAATVQMKPSEDDLDQLYKDWRTWEQRFLMRLAQIDEQARDAKAPTSSPL